LKCLFDNCLPLKISNTLNFLEGKSGIEVIHLSEKFSPNTEDVEWMTTLGKEKDWFVISKDRKIKKSPQELLAWKESKLPIVFLKKNWLDYQFWDLAWRIVKYWPEIKKNVKPNSQKSFIFGVNGKIEEIL
jgi:predicted nuclease of predicted toxin-antitoxin system